MLHKINKRSFKTQAALMTLGNLAPMAPALMNNIGTMVAHADATSVPVPERLSTPSDESLPLLPFTWSIKVVNQQNGQTLKTDDITFTPTGNPTTGKDGGNTVFYDVKDTANIFNKQHVQIDNGDVDFNKILSGATNSNNVSGRGDNSLSLTSDNDAFPNWVFGKKNSQDTPAYILPELNNRDGSATQQAQVSGDANHKVLTFYVIPNTSQTKNQDNNNNSGSYVVPATGQDTGNNKATNNSGTANTGSTNNGATSTNANNHANNSGNTNKTNNAGNSNQQQDADTQQVINAINQHTVNSNDKLPSDAKLLEQVPANKSGFNAYSVQVAQKATDGQITYKHLTVHYNPSTKQFYVTLQGNDQTALTKAQLLQLFGLQSKDNNGGNANGASGIAGSNNLGGTTGSSTGSLAQTNATTKQNASILLSAIVGTATLGLALTKDGKLKLE